MANYVGTALARLLKESTYLPHQIGEAGKAVVDAQRAVEASREALKQARKAAQGKQAILASLESRLATVDGLIKEQSVIDPARVVSRRHRPRRFGTMHGTLIAKAVRLLKSHRNGVSTVHLIDHMVGYFGLPYDTRDARDMTGRAIRRMLRSLHDRGAVRRIGPPNGRCAWIWQELP